MQDEIEIRKRLAAKLDEYLEVRTFDNPSEVTQFKALELKNECKTLAWVLGEVIKFGHVDDEEEATCG